MAAHNQESRLPLKLLVDVKKNKVIAAEANRDFVDILFSFLTFPIGTIIKLTNGSSVSTCMNNLYQSVENLNVEHLYSEHCKSILLNPRNPCVEYCFKLKVKIDQSVSNKYFKCSNKRCTSKSWLAHVNCHCGGRTTKVIYSDITNPTNDNSGVFLRGGIDFIVTDDLKVLPGSPSSLVQLLSNLGYSHMDQIKEMSVEVGKEEISRLLTCSLIAKSPLTVVFLNKEAIVESIMSETRTFPMFLNELNNIRNSGTLTLKLILSKSRNKILYAEAKESFVDLLFSFLTFPLGSVIYALDGISGLGCIDNLYKSVEDLESEWFFYCQERLLNPGIAPRHECQKQLLPISVALEDHSLIDPRDVSCDTSEFGRFTREPSLFIVLDDLEVTPLCSTSSFGLLKELNVGSLYDIEEQVISFGLAEAQFLLQAALIGSSSALTRALYLSSLVNQLKQEKD